MGLFGKPKHKPYVIDTGDSTTIGPSEKFFQEERATFSDHQVGSETEHVRSQLSKLFSAQDADTGGSERDQRKPYTPGVTAEQTQTPPTGWSSPKLGIGKSSGANQNSVPSLPRSVGSLAPSNVENLTPVSAASPGANPFPDVSKGGSVASDRGLWANPSPRKSNQTIPRNKSGGHASSPRSSSPGRLLGQMPRTNSLSTMSRLARKASIKRKHSTVKGSNSNPQKSGSSSDLCSLESLGVPSAKQGASPSPRVMQIPNARKQEQTGLLALSASPTTPHVLPENEIPDTELGIPIVCADAWFEPRAKVWDVRKGSEIQPAVKERTTTPRGNVAAETHSSTVAAESTGPARLGLDHTSKGSETGQWDKLELEELGEADVYGLEVATAREFEPTDGGGERLNNTPASEPKDLPFGDESNSTGFYDGSASSNGGSNSLLAPAFKAHDDADVTVRGVAPGAKSPTLVIPGGGGTLFSGGKLKPKARKRPPPLLTPEPQSGDSPISASPSTGVFGSNGDFTTGGFRITAEGMVGKPERITRMDSDDAPTTGCIPETVRDLSLVRSLAEFRKGPTLGMGAAGRVYLAIHEPSGKSMAMKVVNVYDEAKRNQLLKELDTLSSHISRFLVRFYGAFYDGKGAVHIALEYMEAGCLGSTIQKFGAIPEPVSRMIAADALRALRFLHRHNVLHRDFKTANILLSRRALCAKVSDFGLARDLDAGVSRVDTFVGTVAYMSPERLNGSKYTYASDIWALGISIVECLLGRYPFDRPQSYFDYLDSTRNTKDMLKGAGCSVQAADFVSRCTDADPLRRPTAAQLMEHPWIANMQRDHALFRRWLDSMESVNTQSPASMKSMQSISSFLAQCK